MNRTGRTKDGTQAVKCRESVTQPAPPAGTVKLVDKMFDGESNADLLRNALATARILNALVAARATCNYTAMPAGKLAEAVGLSEASLSQLVGRIELFGAAVLWLGSQYKPTAYFLADSRGVEDHAKYYLEQSAMNQRQGAYLEKLAERLSREPRAA